MLDKFFAAASACAPLLFASCSYGQPPAADRAIRPFKVQVLQARPNCARPADH